MIYRNLSISVHVIVKTAESTTGDVQTPGRFQLQDPHPLDRAVVGTAPRRNSNPTGVLDGELFLEEAVLCQNAVNVGLKTVSRIAT